MKISAVSSSGRRALAVCLAAGLALSACSKEEEASKDEKSTSTTTSQADAKKSEDKDKKKTEDKKAEEKAAEEKKAEERKKAEAEKKQAEAKEAEAAKQNQQEQAKEQPKAPGAAPAQGNAANDEKEIRDLVMGMNTHVNNPHAYMNYRRDNACQRVRNEVGDGAFDEAANNLAGTGLNLIPRIDNINSVQVNGNTARVETTASAQGQSQPAPIDLVKEGGRWKFCG